MTVRMRRFYAALAFLLFGIVVWPLPMWRFVLADVLFYTAVMVALEGWS